MADEVRRIQIEVKWRAAVQTEALRKNNAYPWVLPASPPLDSERSDSTQADSPGSPEFAGARVSKVPKKNVSCRYEATPRPSLIDLDKENIDPSPGKQSGAVTFRSPVSDFSRYIEASPQPDELPLQTLWDRSMQFNHVVNISRIEPEASASGFLSHNKSYISERTPTPSETDTSLRLERCWQGVSQLRADLRSLQRATEPLD